MLNYLNPFNLRYVETLLEEYDRNPEQLHPTWRCFFDGISFERTTLKGAGEIKQDLEFEIKVFRLIQDYRESGFLIADINPLERTKRSHPLLTLDRFGLSEKDLNRTCHVGTILGFGPISLGEILQYLTKAYCSPVTIELSHIDDPYCREWIQKKIENGFLLEPLTETLSKRVLTKLIEAETLETFLDRNFKGQKRFSVEGTDVLIPMVDYLVEHSSQLGADEIILCMTHRGRLNILANIFKKDLATLFAEFSGHIETEDLSPGDGDVKYHMGYSSDITTQKKMSMHLSLAPNPSHLEAINAVVMGITRSKQKMKNDLSRSKTIPVMLHGDGSFSGQGVIYELLNLSELQGYSVGGTIHFIVNNQIGFTTIPLEYRSTPQATDVARMLEIPIFRVNADEPELAIRLMALALEFRNTFKRDIVIDLLGYRRYGHNEGDDPDFTQPMIYKVIDNHPRVLKLYSTKLIEKGILTTDELDEITRKRDQELEEALAISQKKRSSPKMHAFGKRWTQLKPVPRDEKIFKPVKTTMALQTLMEIGKQINSVPEGFHVHKKIARFLIEERLAMLEGKNGIDWNFAEALSFGSLLVEGFMVRLTGQDTVRGTFSQRHAVFHDVENGKPYTPLNHLKEGKADFEVINSPLSEYAALGFEFGESLANPNKLILWEAQFGDFVNGAQILIDQFLTSSAAKWQRYSGLVLLLPHGYEGQGPEHSSARPERFLQASAQHNIQVCNLTTPAQYFHVLRRQMKRDYRFPLIIFTPKSFLRHPLAISSMKDLSEGGFQEILDDPEKEQYHAASKLVLTSGKVYYDLLQARRECKNSGATALIRIEQLYPLHTERLMEIIQSYKKVKKVIWCQEEPQNMGPWNYMFSQLLPHLKEKYALSYVGRPMQASPASGYSSIHKKDQQALVAEALKR